MASDRAKLSPGHPRVILTKFATRSLQQADEDSSQQVKVGQVATAFTGWLGWAWLAWLGWLGLLRLSF